MGNRTTQVQGTTIAPPFLCWARAGRQLLASFALGPIYREVAGVHFSPQVRPHQNSTSTAPSFSSEYHPILPADQFSATFQNTHRAASTSPHQPRQIGHS